MFAICAAQGWFVEYSDQTTRRVVFFAMEKAAGTAFVVDDKGEIRPAREVGPVIGIWYIHDEN